MEPHERQSGGSIFSVHIDRQVSHDRVNDSDGKEGGGQRKGEVFSSTWGLVEASWPIYM